MPFGIIGGPVLGKLGTAINIDAQQRDTKRRKTHPFPAVSMSRLPMSPGLMIGASASSCSFCVSFFDSSSTFFSSAASYAHTHLSAHHGESGQGAARTFSLCVREIWILYGM